MRERGRLRQLVVEHQGQAAREGGHADARPCAEQCERASAGAALHAVVAIEQFAQRADRICWRRTHVDEIVHAGTQRGQHGSRLGRNAGRQHRQRWPFALEALVEFACGSGVVAREVDERPPTGPSMAMRSSIDLPSGVMTTTEPSAPSASVSQVMWLPLLDANR
jgi:hypothetical protein